MSINYQNDQNNPVLVLYDHEYKSKQPILDKIDKGGLWTIESPIVGDIFKISKKGVVEYKKGDVIIDKIRELIITYTVNGIIYKTLFYIKIIQRTLLVTINNDEIITKEYDGTSVINNKLINYIFISNGIPYKFNYNNYLDIEAKFYKNNVPVTFGGSEEELLDISLNIINKSNNYLIDIYSYNYCKNAGYIKRKKIEPENIKKTSKIYDKTTNINIQVANFGSFNVCFENPNAGNRKKIILDNINYELCCDDLEVYGTIKQKPLQLEFDIEDREYNSSQYAIIKNVIIKGIIDNDDVFLSKNYIGTYDNPNYGLNKKITISNIKLKGNDCKNYKVEPIIITKGNIYKKPYNLIIKNIYKEYDGTYNHIINNDECTCEIMFENKNVGTHIVTIENGKLKENAENYFIVKKKLLGTIKKRELKVEFILPEKFYDKTTNIDISYKLLNVISDDEIYLNYEICKLRNPNAGLNYVELRNIKILGKDSFNYYYDENINIEINVKPQKLIPEFHFNELIYGSDNLQIKEINLFDKKVYIDQNKLIIKKINDFEVFIENIILLGINSKNYLINDYCKVKINIQPKLLDVNFILEKTYDGTNKGEIKSYELIGLVGVDDIKINLNDIIVTYQTINSTKKTKVIIDNITIYGEKSIFYEINKQKIIYSDIKSKEVTISFFIENKIYDSTTTAKILNYEITDNLVIESYNANFVDCNVSVNKIKVIITDLKIVGNDLNNYIINEIYETYGYIVQHKLKLEPIIVPKIYDETNNIIIENINMLNVINNDDIFIENYEGYYSNMDIGEIIIKNINIGGTKKENYCVDNEIICYSKIIPKKINIITNKIEKIYDGTTNINIKTNQNITYKSCNFFDINCGKNKKILVCGLQTNNKFYEIDEEQILYGEIKKKELVPIFEVSNKKYDGTNIAQVKIKNFEGIVNNDIVICTNINSYYIDYNVSKYEKDIIVENIIIDNLNYYVKFNQLIKGFIQPIELIPHFKIKSKEFDTTTNCEIESYTLKGIINNDNVEINICEIITNFENPNASNEFKIVKIENIKLIGENKDNYYIMNDFYTKGIITKKKIVPNITGFTKIYDGTTDAKINIDCEYKKAYFETKKAGDQKIIIENIKINSENYYTDSENYCISTIYKKKIIPVFKKTNKIYDKNNSINLEIDKILGIINNDNVFIDNSYESSFISKNIISITGLTLLGTDSINYCIDETLTIEGVIELRELKLEFIIKSKYFDDNDIALIEDVIIHNKISDDDVNINLDYIKATFLNKNASTEKIVVKIENIKLIGNDSKYYYTNTTQYSSSYIYKKHIDCKVKVKDKIYDKVKNATVIFENNFDFNYNAYFETEEVGNNIKVFINNISILDSNYQVNEEIETVGNILPKELDIEYDNIRKSYDGTTKSFIKVKSLVKDVVCTKYLAEYETKDYSVMPIKIKLSNFKLSGILSKNYVLSDKEIDGYIDQKQLEIDFIPNNKEYDKTYMATINSYSIENIVNDEDVDISKDYNLEFIDYNSKPEKQEIIVKNIFLIGKDSKNYFINNEKIIYAHIYPKKIIPTIICKDKIFDKNTIADVTIKLNNIINNDKVICTYNNAYFIDFNVENNKKVIIDQVTVNNKNYTIDNILYTTGSIVKKIIKPYFNIYPKVYDKNNNVKYDIVIFDDLKLFVEMYYETINVSDNIPIIIKNLHFLNNELNYELDKNFNIFGKITKKKLILEMLFLEKEYDGLTDAKFEKYNLLGVCLNDNITIDTDILICRYIKPDASDDLIKIIVENIKLKGNDINNYYIDDYYETFSYIKKKKLDITFNITDKIYDTNNSIFVTYNSSCDILFDSKFENSDAGNNKKVLINNIRVSDNNYYYDKNVVLYASIEKYVIEPDIYIKPVKYGSTENLIIDFKIKPLGNDNLFIKNNFKYQILNYNDVLINNICLDGNDANNYKLKKNEYIVKYIIEPKELNVFFEFENKEYDGTDNAIVKSYNLIGKLDNDDVKLENYICKYETINASDIEKNIIVTKISLIGQDSKKYYINPIKKCKGYIKKRKVMPNITVYDKVYDMKTNAKVKITFSENINFVYKNAYFIDSNVGIDKKVIIDGLILSDLNYEVTNYNVHGNILKKIIDIDFKFDNKIYDKTTSVNNCRVICNINNFITSFNANYEDYNVGNKKIIFENIKINDIYVNNYDFKINKEYYGTIMPVKLNINFIIEPKEFDLTFNVIIKKYELINKIENDDVYLDEKINARYIDYLPSDKKEIYIKNIILQGKDKDNYIVDNIFNTYGVIIKKSITPNIIINEKTYNGLLDVNYNFINSHDFVFRKIYFENKNVGTQKIIFTDLNVKKPICYNLELSEIYGKINKKYLEPDFIIKPKIYDGTNKVKVDRIILKGKIKSDNIEIKSYDAIYEDSNVTNNDGNIGNKKITITNIVLDGVDKNNYYVNDEYIYYSTILPLELDIDFIIEDKIYDKTNIGKIKSYTIKNINQELNLFGTVTFTDCNVRNKIKVIISDVKINNKSANYKFKKEYIGYGVILPKKITINVLNYEKKYDGTKKANILLESDSFIKYDKAEYIDKIVGFNKEITITGITTTDKNYYVENVYKCYGNILPIKLDLFFSDLIDFKVNVIKINNIILNDDVYVLDTYNFFFITENTILVENIQLGGLDSVNYIVDTSYNIVSQVSKKPNEKKVDEIILPKKIDIDFEFIDKDCIKSYKILGVNDENIFIENNYSVKRIDEDNVEVTNINLCGEKSNNYFIEKTKICKYKIKVNIEFIFEDKIYDGTNICKLIDYKVDNDFTKIDLEKLIYYFENENCGKQKIIVINNSEKTVFYANIIPKKVNIDFYCNPKIFDDSTNVNIICDTKLNINYEAYYENKNVGKNKKIIIKNINLNETNYCIDFNEKIIYGDILPKKINISCYDKIYDGLFNAKLKTDIDINYIANFECNKVSNNIKVNVKILDENYYNDDIILGNILPKEIIGITQDKEYDGNTNAIVTLSGVIENDDIYCVGNFIDLNVGMKSVVCILYGNDKDNYILRDIRPSRILPKKLIGLCYNKEYDGTRNISVELQGIINNDIVFINSTLVTENVETDYVEVNGILYGDDSNNYILDKIQSIKILPKKINGICIDKEYDGTNNAKVIFDNNLDIPIIAEYIDKDVGDNKPVIVKIIGSNSNNYQINKIQYGKITPKYVFGIGEDKIYDGNDKINILITGIYDCDINKLVPLKGKTLNTNVGKCDVEIIDTLNLNNYVLKNKFTTTNILPKKINIQWTTTPKTYDKTINCVVIPTKIDVENIFVDDYDAFYDTSEIGLNKKITIKNIKLGGPKHENYITDTYILESSIFSNVNDIYINYGLEINMFGNNKIFNTNNFIYDYIIIFNNCTIEINKEFEFKIEKSKSTTTIEFGESNINTNHFTKTETTIINLLSEIISHKLSGNLNIKIAELNVVETHVWNHILKTLKDKNEIKNILKQYQLLGRNNIDLEFNNLNLCVPVLLNGQLARKFSSIPFYNKGYDTGGSRIKEGKYSIPILFKFNF